METKELNEIIYNDLCCDIGCLTGERKNFNVHVFLSSIIGVVGVNAATMINDFEDDWVTRTIKLLPLLIMIRQTHKLGKDKIETKQSKYYLQLLCEKLEKKEIYINLENFKKAVFRPSDFNSKYFLQDILLGNEMTLSFDKSGEIKYVDSEKNIEITDEVAECYLEKDNLLKYKNNKMRK